MNDAALNQTLIAFNTRKFKDAVRASAEGLASAAGPDEAFWMGLHETCEGFVYLMDQKPTHAERKFISAMGILRNFGFRYENFEVTAILAGIRRVVEEIRIVRTTKHKVFDLSLLPRMKLAAKADD